MSGMHKYTPQPRNVSEWIHRLVFLLHRTLARQVEWCAFLVMLASLFGCFLLWITLERPQDIGLSLWLHYSLLVLCAGLAGASCWLLGVYAKARKGHFLKPVEPEELPVLTSKEVLVRPSSSADAQPVELLRAAREEGKSEELLRASQSQP